MEKKEKNLTIVIGVLVFVTPIVYFIGVILYSIFIDVPAKPIEKHGEFPFELVYE